MESMLTRAGFGCSGIGPGGSLQMMFPGGAGTMTSQSYSFSSTLGSDGRPIVRETRHSAVEDGRLREERYEHFDGNSGQREAGLARAIDDRTVAVRKFTRADADDEQTETHVQNITEDEIANFDREWETSTTRNQTFVEANRGGVATLPASAGLPHRAFHSMLGFRHHNPVDHLVHDTLHDMRHDLHHAPAMRGIGAPPSTRGGDSAGGQKPAQISGRSARSGEQQQQQQQQSRGPSRQQTGAATSQDIGSTRQTQLSQDRGEKGGQWQSGRSGSGISGGQGGGGSDAKSGQWQRSSQSEQSAGGTQQRSRQWQGGDAASAQRRSGQTSAQTGCGPGSYPCNRA